MTLEFQAESKAAAERKALQSGMNVNHVQDITDLEDELEDTPAARSRAAHRGESTGGMGAKLLATLIFLIVAAGLVWFFWGRIKPLIGK